MHEIVIRLSDNECPFRNLFCLFIVIPPLISSDINRIVKIPFQMFISQEKCLLKYFYVPFNYLNQIK